MFFVMIYCRILCQLDTTAKECCLGHVATRCFEGKNQNLEYDLMSEGYLGQYLQAKSSHHYMAPKETATAIQTAETFLSIPVSSSYPKAWQITITLSSILLFTMKWNPKKLETGRKPRQISLVVAGSHIAWIHKASTDNISVPWRGWVGNQKIPLFRRQKGKAESNSFVCNFN